MKPLLCSKCRYDLTGLPGRGTCPECGQRYWITRGKGIYHGDSAEQRGDRALRRARTIILGVLGVAAVVAGILLNSSPGNRSLVMGFGLGGLLLLCAVMSYFTEKDD